MPNYRRPSETGENRLAAGLIPQHTPGWRRARIDLARRCQCQTCKAAVAVAAASSQRAPDRLRGWVIPPHRGCGWFWHVLAPRPGCRRGGCHGPWGGARAWPAGRRRRRPTAKFGNPSGIGKRYAWSSLIRRRVWTDSVSEAAFVGVPAAWAGTGGVWECGRCPLTGLVFLRISPASTVEMSRGC